MAILLHLSYVGQSLPEEAVSKIMATLQQLQLDRDVDVATTASRLPEAS